MKIAPLVKVSLVGIAVAALLTLGASAASATPPPRPLPATQSLYAVACDIVHNATLMSVNPTTAVATLIGSGVGGDSCAGTSAWDAATQTAYYVGSNTNSLYSINLTTGVATDIGAFSPVLTAPSVNTMFIGADGHAYVIGNDARLYSVDLATAAVTVIGSTGLGSFESASAFDPSTGAYYVLTAAGDLYSINVATGAATLVGPLNGGSVENGSFSLQFDQDGTLWVEEGGPPPFGTDLWTYLPTDLTGSGLGAGTIKVGGGQIYTASFLIPTRATAAVASSSVAAGTTVTVTGSGFVGGETVSVFIDGSPTALTTTAASSTGLVSATVTIPSGTSVGSHTLSLVGPTSGTASAAFTATPELASTGVDAQTPLELGAVLVVLGLVFLLTRRGTMRANRSNN
jgi:hypothetical protein